MSFIQDIKIRGLAGSTVVNQFGLSTNVDSGAKTDLWDLTSSIIWVAPTQARTHALVSRDVTDITGLGTLTLAANAGNNELVTIGIKPYKFQTSLTDVDGNVKIGAAATDSIDNLIAAINLAAGAGSTYAASMTENVVDTVAEAGAGDTMRLYDEASTNAITTETMANGSWGSGNTVKGTGARTVKIHGLKTWTSLGPTTDSRAVAFRSFHFSPSCAAS